MFSKHAMKTFISNSFSFHPVFWLDEFLSLCEICRAIFESVEVDAFALSVNTHENDTHTFTVTLSSVIIGILNE